jgi:hypothetical protein
MSGHRLANLDWLRQDLGCQVAPDADPHTSNLEKTRTARLQHAHPTSGSDAQFGKPMHPGWFTANLSDIGPFAGI